MKKQSREDLEVFYQREDPWGYQNNPDDRQRKDQILDIIPDRHYEKTLDIGAGEGWITKDLPGKRIHAIEISLRAQDRIPKEDRIMVMNTPLGQYDLVLATGVLYEQYDWKLIQKWIRDSSKGYILIGGIKSWLIDKGYGKLIEEREFDYRDKKQILKLYEIIT